MPFYLDRSIRRFIGLESIVLDCVFDPLDTEGFAVGVELFDHRDHRDLSRFVERLLQGLLIGKHLPGQFDGQLDGHPIVLLFDEFCWHGTHSFGNLDSAMPELSDKQEESLEL